MRPSRRVLLALLLPAAACSPVRQLPSGAYRVQCPEHLEECRQTAEEHCLGRGGVQEVSSQEKNKLFGSEGHQHGTLVSEVIFYCIDDAPREPIPLPPRPSPSPGLEAEAVPVDPGLIMPETPVAAPAPGRRVCIPGSTQRCIGAGACVGGQTCSPDGTAWDPCDCGPLPGSDAPTAPATGSAAASDEAVPVPAP